ncbi:MAG: chloride channel protein [Anaerolineales bacterium]
MNSALSSKREWLENIQRWFPPDIPALLLGAAMLVGLGTGLGAILFIRLIAAAEGFFYNGIPRVLPALGRAWLLFIPALGGLIAGPIIAFVASEAKGHGVPEVMEAIALRGGRIRPRVVLAKVAASAACIGSGGSAGREGPIVQVGAALGSTIAQALHFSEARIRNLVACGAAAGIAATFNAPIAGVVFALEIVLGELAINDLTSVVLSAVTASTIARSIMGTSPAFIIPLYSMKSPWEIILYLLLGIPATLIGVWFIRSLYFMEAQFDQWRFPAYLKPAVGGLLLGIMGFLYPQILGIGFVPQTELQLGILSPSTIPRVFGSGFPVIEDALLGKISIFLLLTLIVLKIAATSLTLGSGNSGGVFAPALFMGAMTGGAFGWLVEHLFPNVTAAPGSYAMVGMAAVFAAAARAPLTAILIVFEMTDDYRILLPLMSAVVVSVLVAQHLHPESIYTLKLVRRGIRLFRGRDIDVMSAVTAGEIMESNPTTVPPEMDINALVDLLAKTRSHGFPVVDAEGHLSGIVSLSDVRKVPPNKMNLTVADIATKNVIVAYPDERLGDILLRMAPRDLSRMPIVSRTDGKLVGLIRRHHIIRAYEVGVVRRGFALGAFPGALPNTAMGEFLIAADSPLAGKTLGELHLPDVFLVIHVQRGGQVILPHGNTRLESGDVVTVLSRDGDLEALESFWVRRGQTGSLAGKIPPQDAAPPEGESESGQQG